MSIAVGEVMTRSLISVEPNENLMNCSKKIVKNRVNTLLVTNEDKLLGIITSTDILKVVISKHHNLSKLKAIQIATRKVAVIKPSATIHEALAKMRELNFRRLPVISQGALVGVITLKDILKVDPSVYTELGELAEIKEEEIKLSKLKDIGPVEGFCEYCGAFSELVKIGNQALCPDCRAEIV
ncbi:MAG: CBS domain-containing protein [Nanoarchaeota archaeon]|nr:CBS domain-containing protein [Nanoarchaeota archaeon]